MEITEREENGMIIREIKENGVLIGREEFPIPTEPIPQPNQPTLEELKDQLEHEKQLRAEQNDNFVAFTEFVLQALNLE